MILNGIKARQLRAGVAPDWAIGLPVGTGLGRRVRHVVTLCLAAAAIKGVKEPKPVSDFVDAQESPAVEGAVRERVARGHAAVNGQVLVVAANPEGVAAVAAASPAGNVKEVEIETSADAQTGDHLALNRAAGVRGVGPACVDSVRGVDVVESYIGQGVLLVENSDLRINLLSLFFT